MSRRKSRPDLHPSMEPINGKVQPPVVPIRPGRVTNQLQYLQRTVLPALWDYRHAWPFHEPVDTKKLGLIDYFQVIKFPMDLGTVMKRLENHYYWSALDCIRDINILFANCYTYNDPKEDLVWMGQQLEKIFRRQLARMPKVEMEENSTPGLATEKQIGPQASATQADPDVSSTTGLQKSSASSSIGSRFPVTPTDDHNYK
ncbi:hypothetical protein DAPPUDRAFT_261209 [Daphnia pulex]|uniref:Bromo domain-containing protein n=1 Tax=Daphnia pulex TaxID=6669 RepID=E9HKP7_DAPPU|nr:hypothetical protein DAPPUDRAFT_261209 [Daphnia pulex]|eukprot:EFX67701.1 hypothetical protein DAPPUDRAFT_261209 [Daphnia pulex]